MKYLISISSIICFLLLANDIKSQPREVTLIIDTLISNGYNFEVANYDTLRYDSLNKYYQFSFVPLPSKSYLPHNYPNLIYNLEVIDSIPKFQITIDNNSGKLEIRDTSKLNCDTIWIQKLEIKRTHLWDTLYVNRASWRSNRKGVEYSIRESSFITVIKDSLALSPLIDFEIVVNNQSYFCSVFQETKIFQHTTYQGRRLLSRRYTGGTESRIGFKNKSIIQVGCP